jgi:collagenase-like PrtC family protease
MSDLELTVGPLMFLWSPERIADYYAQVAAAPEVSRVYLGEVVCGKRSPLTVESLLLAEEALTRAGKSVVWASQALPATPREARAVRELAEASTLLEVNDVAALACLPKGAAFVAGPMLNLYNESAVTALAARGCQRICANVELSLDAVAAIARACPQVEIELFAYGRLPLALSGRCYHARAHKAHKDGCLFVCETDPDGMTVRTVDGEPFLAVNGIQTMSHGVHLADADVERLVAAGVKALRISPHTGDVRAVLAAFSAFVRGEFDGAGLRAAVAATRPPGPLINGYLHGQAGMLSMETL